MFTHELQCIDGIIINVLIGIEVPEGSTFTVDRNKRVHEQLTKETWHQGSYQRHTTNNSKCETLSGLCAVGWVMAVYGRDYMSKVKLLDKAVDVEKAMGALLCWNDNSGRTFEEVVLLFKQLDI